MEIIASCADHGDCWLHALLVHIYTVYQGADRPRIGQVRTRYTDNISETSSLSQWSLLF